MKNLVLASSGSVYGSEYLEYLLPTIDLLYKDIEEILFIPYAQPSGISYDAYTDAVQEALSTLGIKVTGVHECENAKEAIKNAQGIFVGGGNTFLLVQQLCENDLWEVLKQSILQGTPYLGTSAGTNIAGLTMQTTNDMPIVLPPSYTTLGIVPFNFNAHYIEPKPDTTHRGETRYTRIKEFQSIEDISVLGIKEGSWLRLIGEDIFLRGGQEAYLFKNKLKQSVPANSNIKDML